MAFNNPPPTRVSARIQARKRRAQEALEPEQVGDATG